MNAQNTLKSHTNWIEIGLGMVFLIPFPVLLFASAGRLDWWQGWVYIALFVIITVGGRLWVTLKYPELLEERQSAMVNADVKSWDKILMPLVALIGPLAQVVVAGLDMRFHGSPDFPLWLEVLGMLIVIIGYLFGNWAMLTNRFFSSMVRIQTDRGHHVIQTGPYSIVRHPGYSGVLIGSIGASLLLGSLWSFIPMVLTAIATAIRTKKEDDTLQTELAGYREYTQKTRYRLIPGIW